MAGKAWIPNEYRMNRAASLRAEENRRRYSSLAAENWRRSRVVRKAPASRCSRKCSETSLRRLETWAQRDSLNIATSVVKPAREPLDRRTVWKTTFDNGPQMSKLKPKVSKGKNKESTKEVAHDLSEIIHASAILDNPETNNEAAPWRVIGYLKTLKDSIFPGVDKDLVKDHSVKKSKAPPASAPSSTRVTGLDDTPLKRKSTKSNSKTPSVPIRRTSSTIETLSLGQDRHFAPFNLRRTIITHEPEEQETQTPPTAKNSLPPSTSLKEDVLCKEIPADSLAKLSDDIVILQGERDLETIRRLEETAKLKRQELSDTRSKIKSSLEEEIENNKKLESILNKIKSIRKAGERGMLYNNESQIVCRIKQTKSESLVDVSQFTN